MRRALRVELARVLRHLEGERAPRLRPVDAPDEPANGATPRERGTEGIVIAFEQRIAKHRARAGPDHDAEPAEPGRGRSIAPRRGRRVAQHLARCRGGDAEAKLGPRGGECDITAKPRARAPLDASAPERRRTRAPA